MTNVEEARRALSEKPLKSTSINRIRILHKLKDKYSGLLQPLRFAAVMNDFLSEIDTPLEKNDIIAGRCVDKPLDEEEENLYREFVADKDNLYSNTLFEVGHCTFDWDDLIDKGLTGLKERALSSLEKNSADEDKCVFLRGAIGFYDAMTAFALRYSETAKAKGMTSVANTLYAVATRAPQTFLEAMQLYWLVAFVDCAYITANPTLSLGRPDRFLYKLYKSDREKGVGDDEIRRIIIDYYCKHNLIMGRGEHQRGDESNTTGWSRILNFDAPQYLHLAGTDENGKPAVNRLTQLFAECIQPGLKNPVVVVRYYEGMAKDCPDLWATFTEKALKSCSLMFYNDNDVISAFEKMGVPAKDARDYEHFGCNWAGLGKNSCWMLMLPRSRHFSPDMTAEEREELKVNYYRTFTDGGWAEDFMIIAHELAGGSVPPRSIDDFYAAFMARVEKFIAFKLEKIKKELEVRCRHASAVITYGDCFRVPPIETGTANNASAAKWHFEIQTLVCFASLVDNFTVVDKLVYRDKKYSLQQLLAATDADYEGYDEIFADCRAVAKFGSDEQLSNYHARRVLTQYLDIMRRLAVPYARKYGIVLMPSVESDTNNIKMGSACGATFDARKAGEPFSQNMRPSFGACTSGFVGMLSALLKLPMDGLASGALNVDIQPQNYAGESGRELLGKIVAAYLDNGGLHMQISCQSVDELLDAQIHPERHRDLMVRVTGYSGIFVDMSKEMQNYVIERLKQ